jgi:branched-chain amino acid transport system permease protein
MDLFLQTMANSVVASAMYAVIAVGLVLMFGVMRMANFAHGEFFMVGGYAVWLLYVRMHWPYWVALVMAMVVVTVIGLAVERGIFKPLRGQVVSGYIATAGIMFILQVATGRIWGVGLSKPVPPPLEGALVIGSVAVGWQRVILIPIVFGSIIALRFFLHRAKLGRGLRACAQNPEAAALQGISTDKMSALAMGIGAAFAGLAGGLFAPLHVVEPYMGHPVILMAFIVIIVGGMGSIEGAVLASILFGFIYTITTTLIGGVAAMIICVVAMLIVLAVRPQGLLGREKV